MQPVTNREHPGDGTPLPLLTVAGSEKEVPGRPLVPEALPGEYVSGNPFPSEAGETQFIHGALPGSPFSSPPLPESPFSSPPLPASYYGDRGRELGPG